MLDGLAKNAFNPVRIEEELWSYLKNWPSLAQANPAQARQILRKLLPSRIRIWREVRGGERSYHFEGETAVGKLFNGIVNIEKSGVPNRTTTLSIPHLAHFIIPFSGVIKTATPFERF